MPRNSLVTSLSSQRLSTKSWPLAAPSEYPRLPGAGGAEVRHHLREGIAGLGPAALKHGVVIGLGGNVDGDEGVEKWEDPTTAD